MRNAIILLALYIIECLPMLPKRFRYRNVNAIGAAFWCFVCAVALDLLLPVTSSLQYMVEDVLDFVLLQVGIIVIVKLVSQKSDSYVKYGIPVKYSKGWRYSIISRFYETEQKNSTVYTKNATNQIGIVTLLCGVVLVSTVIYQLNAYSAVGNTLFMPFSLGALFSLLIEFAVFCLGESKWGRLISKYKARRKCRNRRELAKARFSAKSDFSYIFMKNFVWEPLHIIRATKFRWKKDAKDAFESAISYFDFENKSRTSYAEREYNPELEEFVKSNGMIPNDLYITAYNLLEREQNVLLKTPSYVDFEPYLVAIIKMKVAKTQNVVLIVNNEEKKALTKQKMNEAFNEYMGFDEIPVMLTIDECVKRQEEQNEEEENKKKRFSHFYDLTNKGKAKVETGEELPIKNPDIVIAAPEDICDPEYVGFLRNMISRLGLIVYYDFGDCVQEEALFAKIVHSVLDYDDKISCLYMSDGFFDLEQVVDNFFSKRNIYEILVPRKPSKESYIMAWKAENINEMQSRTNPDASRDMGNHIPILYDAGGHTENDFILVEDEFDTYAENRINFKQREIAERFDYHVGWTDVFGGKSVMCTVSDTYNNVAHTYLAMSGVGEESEYINIISRPYLLRNYLMYHLRYFTLKPGVLASYSPGLIKTPKAVAYEAIVKLFVIGCTATQLVRYVEKATLACDLTPEVMIKMLIRCAEYEEAEDVEITKDAYGRYFIDERTYKNIICKAGFLEKIYFITNRQVIVRNKRDYSDLIPQQKIILNGVKYTVEKIINENRVELTDSNTREPLYIMRPIRSCEIKLNDIAEDKKYIQHNGDSAITFKRYNADVDISVYGSIVFKDSYHPFREDAKYDYHTVAKKQDKVYKNVSVFHIQIENRHISVENYKRVSHLFALLMNEMLPTFFPRHHKRIIIGCSGWNIGPEVETQDITTLHTIAQMNIENEKDTEGKINLYVLEDSSVETGLVNVFWQDEEFRYMLKILEDYLYYQKFINRRERKEIFADSFIGDLALLKKILLEVINESFEVYGPDGDYASAFMNKIRTSKNKYNNLDIMRSFDITCDFCGKRIIPKASQEINYHFYAYSGMVSCMDCFRSAVCTETYSKDDIEGLETIVNAWFDKKYGEQVPSDYYNYLEDAERISELANATTPMLDRYISTDDCEADGIQGLVPIGAERGDNISVWNNAEEIPITGEIRQKNEGINDVERASYLIEDMGKSYILIRNGLPFKHYMGVLAHEMTHQWQITSLNLDKMCANTPGNEMDEFGKRIDLTTFRIEGHAEWERIRYLKRNGAWFYAAKEKRVLKATRNAYGIGYIWMSRLMRLGADDLAISVKRDFMFYIKRNWYQLTKNSFKLMRLYFGVAAELAPTAEPQGAPIVPSPEPVGPKPPFEPKNEVTYYCYSQLPENLRAVYDTVCNAVQQHQETVEVSDGVSFEDFNRVYNLITYDHPEFFWYPGRFMKTGNSVSFTYPVTAEERKELQVKIDEAAAVYFADLNNEMSEYDILLSFFERLINSTDYDTLALEAEKQAENNDEVELDYIRSICGPFINGKAVCAGYARALQYLLQKCGIECTRIRGNIIKTDDSEGGTHAWDLVKIDGEYYYVDATWDDNSDTNQQVKDTSISYDYFCITSEELLRSRDTVLTPFEIPVCTATKANYFYHNGCVIEEYNVDAVMKLAKECAARGERIVRFKCASSDVFDKAIQEIRNQDCFKIGNECFGENHANNYSSNPKMLTITLDY